MKNNIITIIGANGNMGAKISALFAAFTNAKVYMIGRSIVSMRQAVNVAKDSVRSDIIETKLHILTYDNCEEVLQKSDLIFESVAEKKEVKSEINKLISKYANDNALIATGTSGLSIDELSLDFTDEQKKRYLGMHFFNPPYSMVLCELIPSKYTDKKLIKEVENFLDKGLKRTIIYSKDKPAFVANRIGFEFINMCLLYADKYKEQGGINYIDSIVGPFTGRNMAPIATANFVGLDITKSIVDNVYQNSNDFFHEYFKCPEYISKLINEGKIGKKVNEGLFKTVITEEGNKLYFIYDLDTNKYIEHKKIKFDFATKIINELRTGNYKILPDVLLNSSDKEAKLCFELLAKYIIYGIYVGYEIGENIDYADDAMATGFNWIPPLALLNLFGGKELFIKKVKDLKIVDDSLIELFKNICPDKDSKYDYRKYLKAIY